MKILETSEQHKQRIKIESERSKCPECGSTTNLGLYQIETKGFLGLKTRKVYTVRCTCGCLYEYADEWK